MDQQGQNGLMDTYRDGLRTRGPLAYVLSALLIVFYCLLYFTPRLDSVAQQLGLLNRWFFYGALYSCAMTAGAFVYLRRHGNSRYNRVRIATNVGVQIGLAFALPFAMALLEQPAFYFSYLWPLDIYLLFPTTLRALPWYLAAYGMVGSLLLAPLLALRFGKRWYCSWVCGCGGLANTFGDPFRHLTSSSERSHRRERWLVYSVLGFAVATTALLAVDAWLVGRPAWLHRLVVGGGASWPWLGQLSLKGIYGFVVGSVLAGVVGTGLYPLLGPRVWCRNFCPMAAVLGLVQKVGRFHIRVKPDMCISCGNCTAYCEMGIDVRAYAERNESFVRAACVGCGMCAHVCPRGVLRLEQRPRRQADGGKRRLPVH